MIVILARGPLVADGVISANFYSMVGIFWIPTDTSDLQGGGG